ncbi:DUF6114 domain-containing protein [Haloarchaeobius sp. TZWWS8]|uniref:DUF6114 domain-containing protein n=1 Tax=Haloarchaeobius sp. TZWWS8 TaxID=3446121 RepID=UPI003EB8B7FE
MTSLDDGSNARDPSARERFAAWRAERPFWGGAVLTLGGLIIGIIPLDLALRFTLVPNHFGFVGLIFAILVTICGLTATFKPELSTPAGATGILFSLASLFGALGGFLIGMFLGALGGSLCVAWRPPAELEEVRENRPGLVTRVKRATNSVVDRAVSARSSGASADER